jgi:hypothetical protein
MRRANAIWVLTAGVVLWMGGSSRAQEKPPAPPSPLTIVAEPPPPAVTRLEYLVRMRATGGKQPLRWSIFAGTLPPGLSLDETSGVISGVPTQLGEFHITVEVNDSDRPPSRRDRELTIKVNAPLMLEWSQYPRVDSDAISGSVKISNGTADMFDQTVIILAVNEYGKAFTLGYQHFELKPSDEPTEITFGLTLPRGTYTIHADAIAEVEVKNEIFRNRLQTPKPLEVTAP